MTSSATTDARVESVVVSADAISVRLVDGRTITAPLDWYPRLADGTPAEHANYRIEAQGHAIHWPDLDEDLLVEHLLDGKRSLEGRRSLERWRASRRQSRE
jgi:hypothetical protein